MRCRVTTLRLALLGCGSVGSQVVRLLREQADDLTARDRRAGGAGRRRRTAAGAAPRPRSCPPSSSPPTPPASSPATTSTWSSRSSAASSRPAALILSALEHGASVVTANKALLAEDGGTLFAAAEQAGRDLYFEAAVAGAIPIVRPLRESLAGDKVRRVLGIVNGTTNFILDRMDGSGAGFAEALEEAQRAGLRRGRPDRRRRGVRRGGEGRDPGQPRLPHPRHRRRRLPRGHRRGQRQPTWPQPGTWAAWSSCWRSASCARARTGRPSRRGSTPR